MMKNARRLLPAFALAAATLLPVPAKPQDLNYWSIEQTNTNAALSWATQGGSIRPAPAGELERLVADPATTPARLKGWYLQQGYSDWYADRGLFLDDSRRAVLTAPGPATPDQARRIVDDMENRMSGVENKLLLEMFAIIAAVFGVAAAIPCGFAALDRRNKRLGR